MSKAAMEAMMRGVAGVVKEHFAAIKAALAERKAEHAELAARVAKLECELKKAQR